MDEGLCHVGEFVFIHSSVAADEESRSGVRQRVLRDGLIQSVDICLRILAHVDVAEARRRAFHLKQRVKDKRILSVIVPAAIRQIRVILRGVQHLVPHILAVVQHDSSAAALFVVPVHHSALVCGVHAVIVEILAHLASLAAELSHQLRILLLQQVVVHKCHLKQVPAVLDIFHARLPEQVQQIHPPDGNIPQSVELRLVPEDTVYPCAAFELVVPCIRVRLLEFVLLQDHRHDSRQHFRLGFVALLPRQDIGRRIVVHSIGVLVGDAVEQPAAGGLHWVVLIPHLLPVPHLVPLLVFNDPALQIGLAALVALQHLSGLQHAVPVNGLFPHGHIVLPRRLIQRIPLVDHSITSILPTRCAGSISSLGMSKNSACGDCLYSSALAAILGLMGLAMQKYRTSSAT